jgi:hypothetical protein
METDPHSIHAACVAFGFGGKVGRQPVDHCFPLNSNEGDPEVHGVSGILEAYKEALLKYTLSGPTLFTQIISQAMSMVADTHAEQQVRCLL